MKAPVGAFNNARVLVNAFSTYCIVNIDVHKCGEHYMTDGSMGTSVMPNFSPMSLQALSASLRDRKPLLSLSTMENTWHHHPHLVPAGVSPHLLDLLLVDVVRALRLPDPAVAPQLVHHILSIGRVIIYLHHLIMDHHHHTFLEFFKLYQPVSTIVKIVEYLRHLEHSTTVHHVSSTCLSKSSKQHQS